MLYFLNNIVRKLIYYALLRWATHRLAIRNPANALFLHNHLFYATFLFEIVKLIDILLLLDKHIMPFKIMKQFNGPGARGRRDKAQY